MATEDTEPSVETNSPVYSMYHILKDLCMNNADYFQGDDSENGQRLHAGFLAIIDHVNTVTPLVDEIRTAAPSFDFDEKSPGNGYRSFVAVVDMCVQHGVKLNRQVIEGRDSFLFRKGSYTREIEACSHVMASLGTCMQHMKTLLSWCKLGELFPSGEHSPEELLKQAESINMYCFYGRCLGFQFCESMQTVLKTISICMASFSEIYYGNGSIFSKATNSVWTGGKYLLDPELRARRIVNISQNASVDFCKSFWLLAESELMSRLPGMVCPAVAVNRVIQIPPEPLQLPREDGGPPVAIPVPSAHLGPGPVPVRLLSAVRRQGMIGEAAAVGAEGPAAAGAVAPSPWLVIHVHGGGFVAQSSRSHESYLRDWACQLGIPILSVDYSLAPQAPYPRALEEVLYAYCWALRNSRVLGSTAEHVILVGDSAGGNLNLGVALKCIELGIRQPSALFLAYVPVLVSFVPSPSRLLCLMDPLLPFGFMIRCLKAYACPSPHNSELDESSTATDLTKEAATSNNSAALASSLSNNTLDNTISLQQRTSPNGLVPGSETESFEEKTPEGVEGGGSSSGATPTASVLARDTTTNTATATAPSEQYVSDFLEKYVLDTETDAQGRQVPVLREAGAGPEPEEQVLFELPPGAGVATSPPAGLAPAGLSARLGRAAGSFASGVASTFLYMTGRRSPPSEKTPTNEPTPSPPAPGNRCSRSSSGAALEMSLLDGMIQRSPSEEFQFTVPRDPFLSPYWADDSLLQQLPPLSLLSAQMDPCLDDCVMFAKKLKALGNTVQLDVLEGLPHGFLNFSLVSRDAHSGSNLCVRRIQELFEAVSKSQ